MSREPQPEKGTILLICFEAMFERMSLFSCPDRKISSEEKGISSEEIAINVQLYPISSDFFGRYCLNCTEKGYFFGKNTHKCTFLYRLNFLCENQLKSTSKIFWNGWNELFFDIISEDITFISSEEITINVQKRGISSEETAINVHFLGRKGYFFGRNSNKCTIISHFFGRYTIK